jgi:hypothetical protein
MTSYKQRIATVPPPTLEKQLEVLAAARALLGQDDEAARRRRDEIAALRREHGELVQELQELWRQYDPRLRSHVIRDDPEQQSVSKASPDDPKHPGWPAGTPDGRGGKFRPKDGDEGAPAAVIPAAYRPNPYFPPVPRGYDPKTWKQGTWPRTDWLYLKDPNGNTYTAHPEDPGHWRHWDKQDGDGNDQGRWPPNSLKPRPGQKKLSDDQSVSDPNGDEPPWTPNPFVPVNPIKPTPIPRLTEPLPRPTPFPATPAAPPIETNPPPAFAPAFPFEELILIPE